MTTKKKFKFTLIVWNDRRDEALALRELCRRQLEGK